MAKASIKVKQEHSRQDAIKQLQYLPTIESYHDAVVAAAENNDADTVRKLYASHVRKPMLYAGKVITLTPVCLAPMTFDWWREAQGITGAYFMGSAKAFVEEVA